MYSQIVPSGNTLLSCNEYLINKCEDIHKQAFDIAIESFKKENHINESSYSISEIKNKDWKKAPYIILTYNHYPFNRKKISLEKWWNISFASDTTSSWKDVILDDDSMKDAEITSIDYVNGIVDMESKLTGNKFKMPFSRLDENTRLNIDKCTLSGTFTYIINNN